MQIEQEIRQYLQQDMGFSIDEQTVRGIIDSLALQGVNAEGDFGEFACEVASRFAVHETYFLRHHEQFDWLEHYWLPRMLEQRDKKHLHILSAGCATGEEPYSLYAHLFPVLQQHGMTLSVDAVDVCKKALEKAQAGRYGLWSMRGVDAEKEKDWLTIRSREVEVKAWVKRGVHFHNLNIIKPFLVQNGGLYDLVLCRNVMIYMHNDAVDSVYRNLLALMNERGLLMPGPSDPNPGSLALPMRFDHGVRVFGKNDAVFAAADAASGQSMALPVAADKSRPEMAVARQRPGAARKTAQDNSHARAEALIRNCEYDQARSLLEGRLLQDPLDVYAYVLLALMAMELDDQALATMAVRKAFFLEPESPYVMYLRANFQQMSGDEEGEQNTLQALQARLASLPADAVVAYSPDINVQQLTGAVHARIKR